MELPVELVPQILLSTEELFAPFSWQRVSKLWRERITQDEKLWKSWFLLFFGHELNNNVCYRDYAVELGCIFRNLIFGYFNCNYD